MSETRRTHKHLGEAPTLVGLTLGGWLLLIVCAAPAYAWIAIAPLGTRLSISVAVIGLSIPVTIMLIRQQTALSPGALILAVLRSRGRAGLMLPTRVELLGTRANTRHERRAAREVGRSLASGRHAVMLTAPLPPPDGIDLSQWWESDEEDTDDQLGRDEETETR